MQTNPQAQQAPVRRLRRALRRRTSFWAIGLLLAAFPGIARPQAAGSAAQSPATPAIPAPSATSGPASVAGTMQKTKQAKGVKQAPPVRNSDRRRAAKLYLEASKLFVDSQFEQAMRGYEQAAKLDPENTDYQMAAKVARNHLVTALIQAAAKDRQRGDEAAAYAVLDQAFELDPKNPQVSEHLYELGDDALLGQSRPLYEQDAETAGDAVELEPAAGVRSFHLRADQRQIIQQVFKAYGIEATVDDSVRPVQVRLDVDNVSFETAAHILGMITTSFYVPLDAHRALVAHDSKENRQQFTRQNLETVYLSGLTSEELTEIANLAKNVFQAQQAVAEPASGTITLRAPEETLNAFNDTMRDLLDGRNQVLLDVRMFQLAYSSERNTGAQLPQSVSAFNVYAEEQSILNANQSLVQQIVSSGLASANDPLAILGILLAAGQISGSMLTNGVALFGGGLTQSALSPGALTLNLNLNSSDSRELDQMQLRLGDGETATISSGTQYPIQTASYSSPAASVPNIPGLTGAGASGSLSSLLSSYTANAQNIPQVQYQQLGLSLKAIPKVMRNNEVALTIDMKLDALAGTFVNGNPVLNSRSYSGVVTLKEGEAVEVVSELDKSESRAISGTPGISQIPGLSDLTGNTNQKNYATLLIVMTPRVIRGTQAAGHSPMMRVERGQQAHP